MSFSGVPKDTLILFIQKDNLTIDQLEFALNELNSINELFNTWVLFIKKILNHNTCIYLGCLDIVHAHCEHFEEYDKLKKKQILFELIHGMSDHSEVFRKNTKDICDDIEKCRENKRYEQKIWKNINHNEMSSKLRFVAQNFPEIEYKNLRILCIRNALLIT